METRWCLSYLRGPLTRQQIKSLMDPIKSESASAPAAAGSAPKAAAPQAPASATGGTPQPASASSSRPILPNDIPQYFIPARALPPGRTLRYQPMLLGIAKVYYSDTKAGVDQEEAQREQGHDHQHREVETRIDTKFLDLFAKRMPGHPQQILRQR